MCAIKLVNGTYSCENEPLLIGLLKTELGFPGMVISDIFSHKTLLGPPMEASTGLLALFGNRLSLRA